MYAEKFAVDKAGKWDSVKEFHCDFVGLLVVLVEACLSGWVHSCRKLKEVVRSLHSWLPLSIMTCLGRVIFIARIRVSTSIEKLPLST